MRVRRQHKAPTALTSLTEGFDLSVLGDIVFTIDGKMLDLADTVTYRGMMFTGVPNMAWVFGYFPGKLDLARRSGRRFRLPPDQSHEGEGG
jgi:cation diffusion facilitator CzcD-associated flavoprotein CzcO